MKWEPLKTSLSDECITRFTERYHFGIDQKKEVERCYRQLFPLIHAMGCMVVSEHDLDSNHTGDADNKQNNINSDQQIKYAYCIITLGDACDIYVDNRSNAGDYEHSYMAECLANEFLDAAYEDFDRYIISETGLWPGDYRYVGSHYPIERMPYFFDRIGQKQVRYNEAYALIPRSSVAFVVPLYDYKIDKHDTCEMCRAVKCPNRRSPYIGKYRSNENQEEANMSKENGLIHLYTGEGKGKTTAAIGLAVRAAGAGKKVVFAQFMKGQDTSEIVSLDKLDNITVIRNSENLGWFKDADEEKKMRFKSQHDNTLDEVLMLIASNRCDVLILDEVTYPVNYKIIDMDKLMQILNMKENRPEIVMTGRNADDILVGAADYITNMECVEHPYEKGIQARKGIEF